MSKKQLKYDKAYLRMASEWAKLSYCERKKVGALIVKDRMIISDGYNGTPTGMENICEDDNETPVLDELGYEVLDEDGNVKKENKTKWYVLHAEANAILKVASSTHSCRDATLYLTMSPCKECSKLIHQAGIKRLVYMNRYKDDKGLNFLVQAGVEVEQIVEITE